jgi:NAD(P) transhydrogenase subunit alpha
MEDEVIRGMTVIKDGEITYPPPPVSVSAMSIKKDIEKSSTVKVVATKNKPKFPMIGFLITMFLLIALGSVAPSSFMNHFTVFVLSCFIGYMVVWNVTASLHTPLMSVTNAVSSIIIIGALTQISSDSMLSIILASIAILIASINIFGGFAVTKRMLEMFRK